MEYAAEWRAPVPADGPGPSAPARSRRRVAGLVLLGGLAIAASPFFPLIRCSFNAPQYPTQSPTMDLYANRIEGQTAEFQTLSRYIGVRFPPDVPELRTPVLWAILLILGLGVGASAFAPRRVRNGIVLGALVALTGLAGWGQYRFYQSGHDLDPDAPMRQVVKPFTPPLFGRIALHRIRIYHLPHVGSLLILAGATAALAGLWGRRRELAGGGDPGVSAASPTMFPVASTPRPA